MYNNNLIYFDFNFNNKINKYVSIILQGGLGNQLFQIATAYAYAKKYNKKLIFKYLDKFKNNYNLERKSFWYTLFNNKLNILNNDEYDKISFQLYNEIENYKWNDIPFFEENVLLFGYYQSFIYLENENTTRDFLRHLVYSSEDYMYKSYNLYNDIKKYFKNISNIECEDDDIVSMHIRRTDYIYTPDNYHLVLDLKYYIEAQKITNKNNIVIFSDDIEWCKKNINSKIFHNDNINLYFVDINNVEVEFILLSLIKHNIIANSTFSLMASYISYYSSKKIIIAPKKWLSASQENIYGNNIKQIYHKDISHII